MEPTRHAVAYTDGANSVAKSPSAAAAVVLHVPQTDDHPDFVLEWGRFLGTEWTNAVAELAGMEMALEAHAKLCPESPLEVYTDSRYVQGVLTRKLDGWAWKAKKNKALIERIRERLPRWFQIKWVRGHDGDFWNDRADAIAKMCKHTKSGWRVQYGAGDRPPVIPMDVKNYHTYKKAKSLRP